MYNIYKPAYGEADYLIGTVVTEEEAKLVLSFFETLNKEDKSYDEDDEKLYYRRVVPSSVLVITDYLDLQFGVRDEAWGVRHDVVWGDGHKY